MSALQNSKPNPVNPDASVKTKTEENKPLLVNAVENGAPLNLRRQMHDWADHFVAKKMSYIEPCPRISCYSLNPRLRLADIQEDYFRRRPESPWLQNVTVVDDFFKLDAIESLRKFSLNSTIWTNEFKGGYVGSFGTSGFDNPLLQQMSLETQAALPRILLGLPLIQQWAFRYSPVCRGINFHADFSKVTVNLWLTPTEANLDDTTGGLVITNVRAPKHWNFNDYNRNGENIEKYVREQPNYEFIKIPYRQNRVVIFESRYFHSTDAVTFKQGYENSRINVSFLFGGSENPDDGSVG